MLNLYYNSQISDMVSKLSMTVDLCIAYLLILILMTLTLMQGHSGSAHNEIWGLIISTTRQATRIKLAATVCHASRQIDFEIVYVAWLFCFVCFKVLSDFDFCLNTIDDPLCVCVCPSQAIPRKLFKSLSSILERWLPQIWECEMC